MAALPQLLEDFLACWNAHDVDPIVALYRADAVMVDPTLAQPIRGRAALRRYHADLWSNDPGSHLSASCADATPCGVAWTSRFSGERDGGWLAVGASYFSLDGGLIAADHAVWNPSTLP